MRGFDRRQQENRAQVTQNRQDAGGAEFREGIIEGNEKGCQGATRLGKLAPSSQRRGGSLDPPSR